MELALCKRKGDSLETSYQQEIWGRIRGVVHPRSKGRYSVGFWKEIRKEWPLMKSKIVFSEGDGKKVRFWEDRWYGDYALSISFPSLYALATSKEAQVVEVWDSLKEKGGWNPWFSGLFNDQEMEMVERFLFSLQGKRVVTNLEDRILWKEAKDENFSVRTLYNVTEGSRTVLFPKSVIWSPCVPTKVVFFAWEASWSKILTQDQLKKRGWSLSN